MNELLRRIDEVLFESHDKVFKNMKDITWGQALPILFSIMALVAFFVVFLIKHS